MEERQQISGEIVRGFAQMLWANGMRAWEYDVQERKLHRYTFERHEQENNGFGGTIENAPESIVDSGIIHSDDAPKFLALYERIIKGEKQVNTEIRAWVEKRRTYVWLQVSGTIVHEEDGQVLRVMFLSRDISDRKQLERRFADETRYWEEISRSILATGRRNLSTGTWEQVVIHGMEITLPEEIRKTTDYRARAAYFLLDVDIPQEDAERLTPEYLQGEYARGVRSVSFEYNARTIESNEPVRIRVDCSLRKRPDTDELIAFYYESDITQEFCVRSIMDSVMQHEYDLLGVLFASSNSIYSKGKECERTTSLPKLISNNYDDVCVKFMQEYGCGENLDEVIASMQLKNVQEHLEQENTYIIEFDVREPNGEVRRKELRYSYIDKEAQLIAVSRRDVHDIVMEEKEKQERLERALNFAEHANSAKSEFLSRMSHEMRTPMNAINGLVALARQEIDNKDVVLDYLDKINVSSRHLLNLINDVLDMAKIESGRLELQVERCYCGEVLAAVESIISPLCDRKGIEFVCDEKKCSDLIMIDRLRFQQVLINLLSNAVKFTPEGGVVCFKHRSYHEGNRLKMEIEVSDSGVGMSEEFQKRMFQPFTQEARTETASVQGTGLGLAITKAIVDKMGGSIEVCSHIGHGTRFIICMDCQLVRDDVGQDNNDTEPQGIGEALVGKKVLLVEDHPMNQLIARRILQNNGIQVITVDNGEAAVNFLRKATCGDVDAVLMDIRMPVMDGITATKLIRQMPQPYLQELPIIAMTANAFDEDVEKTKAAGMNHHLAKPIDPSLLLRTLRDCIEKYNS